MLRDILEDHGNTVLVTHYADLVKYVCTKFFGWNGVKDDQGRAILQYVGTDVVRAKDPNYWIDFVISILRLFPEEWDYVIIPDARFPNEISRLTERSFHVTSLRINRPGFDNGLTESQKKHPSETSLDNEHFDYVIENSGSLEELEEKLFQFAEEHINASQK